MGVLVIEPRYGGRVLHGDLRFEVIHAGIAVQNPVGAGFPVVEELPIGNRNQDWKKEEGNGT